VPKRQKVEFDPNTPLGYCIQQFNGLLSFCAAVECFPIQVYKWRKQGGSLPADVQTEVLDAGRRYGIEIDAARLVKEP